MKTGEGKTLVATLPHLPERAQRHAASHLVTVNDYLARRDVQWMGPIYNFLGLDRAARSSTTRASSSTRRYIPKDYRLLNLRPVERRDAYRADITYGTNNEFGFDYLARQHEVRRSTSTSSASSHFAIVDEVDNILIDEARTPLIISGPAEESTEQVLPGRPHHPAAHEARPTTRSTRSTRT